MSDDVTNSTRSVAVLRMVDDELLVQEVSERMIENHDFFAKAWPDIKAAAAVARRLHKHKSGKAA